MFIPHKMFDNYMQKLNFTNIQKIHKKPYKSIFKVFKNLKPISEHIICNLYLFVIVILSELLGCLTFLLSLLNVEKNERAD